METLAFKRTFNLISVGPKSCEGKMQGDEKRRETLHGGQS